LRVRTPLGEFTSGARHKFRSGTPVWLGFRPEAVQLQAAAVNRLDTVIRQVNYLGEIEEYLLEAGGLRFKAFEQNPEALRVEGSALPVSIRPADLLILPR
jgi:ABC-type Fe3+/spermidine/putrescine transport system ATPase subunit